MTSLTSLPPEVLEQILLFVDWRTILRAQQINKDFDDIVRSSKAVQYYVELGVVGMVDGPPYPRAPYTVDERLNRLRTYQARWKRVQHVKDHTVRAVKGSIWELASGVLAQGISVNGDHDVRKLYFVKLPSDARGNTKMREWTHPGYDFAIRDFTLDETQDLLVLLRLGSNYQSVEIQFRSLRTNAKHPEAKLGAVTHDSKASTHPYSHLLQICHDRFCILHVGLHEVWPDKMVMYNWKKGTTEFAIEFCGISSFSFISYNHLLFAVQPFNVMPARSGDHQPRFIICDIDKTSALYESDSEAGAYVAVSELHLPEMKPFVEIEEILIRCDPTPAPGIQMSEESLTEGRAPPFMISPQNRIFVITLGATVVLDDHGDHRADATQTLCIFVPLSTLSPFINPTRNNTEPEVIPANKPGMELFLGDYAKRPRRGIAVPWTDWMRDGARALSVPGAEVVWICNVFGSRFVHALEPIDPHVPRARRRVAVLDFNMDAVRLERARKARDGKNSPAGGDEEDATRVEERVEPSTLEAHKFGVFEDDVTTCLPYRRTVFPEKVRFDGVMLSEDNIIFVNRKAPKNFEVYTF